MSDVRRPVSTSAVYIMDRVNGRAAAPPPSPPSPGTATAESKLCAPIEELSLDTPAHDKKAGKPTVVVKTRKASKIEDDDESMPATAPTSARGSIGSSPVLSAASPVSSASTPMEGLDCVSHGFSNSLEDRLAGAIHVLGTEAHALQTVAKLYATNGGAREGFSDAVNVILRTQTQQPHGKLVIVGVGKSGHIGKKLAATFNSLAVPASFLHPTEALHGDLGHVDGAVDALMFITYSGKTQELMGLLPHLDPTLPLILLTAHVTMDTCKLIEKRQELHGAKAAALGVKVGPTVLLPAPIPVEEKVSFGVSAPTSSTTTALAVGDALAIVASKELHPSVIHVFHKNHPGGAIGDAAKAPAAGAAAAASAATLLSLAVPWADIPVVKASKAENGHGCADVLRAGYSSSNGWVRVVHSDDAAADDAHDGVAAPSRIAALVSTELTQPVQAVKGLVVGVADLVVMAADTKARSAAEWLRAASTEDRLSGVIAVADKGEIVGVLEKQDLLDAHPAN